MAGVERNVGYRYWYWGKCSGKVKQGAQGTKASSVMWNLAHF